jgi:hypothetical protein
MSTKKRVAEAEAEQPKKRMVQTLLVRSTRGKVCVAKYYPGKPLPSKDGYRTIHIHISATPLGGDLSPYVLRDEKGRLLENVWQFSKIYRRIARQRISKSRYQKSEIIWEHGEEQHIAEDGSATPAYWAWRRKGQNNQFAVRYPAGFHERSSCVASLWMVGGQLRWLDYIAARKHIYCGEYARLAPHTPHFKALSKLLDAGENLLIVEVDGPDPTLSYGPYANISPESPCMQMDEETCKYLIEDVKKPFGHGFVIAALLLGGADWMKPDE